MSAVRVRGVGVTIEGVRILEGIDIDVAAGHWLSVLGPNGAGKSTLLRTIAGLADADGEMMLDGHPVASLRRRQLARLVSFVPQQPEIPLGMIVADYVLLGRTPYISYLGVETKHDIAVVQSLLRRLDVSPLSGRPLRSLSGGELQRVVIAQALARQAPILLLDEPTTALDVGHQQEVLELIDALRRQDGLTVVAAMHDLTLAAQFADRVVLLTGGRIAAEGTPEAVLNEHTISEHFGASVRVIHDSDGSFAIVPVRARSRRADVSEDSL